MTRFPGGVLLIAVSLLPLLSLGHTIRAGPLPVEVGCFSSSQPLISQGHHKYQSSGYCADVCTKEGLPVLALSNGTICYCGIELPPKGTKVKGSNCDTPCQGYNLEDCGGGLTYFTVWLTGLRASVPHYSPYGASSSSTSSASSTRGAAATHHTNAGSPSTTTSRAPGPSSGGLSSSSSSHTHSSTNKKLAIGLGVGLGLLAILILALLILWLLRRRKRTDEYVRELSPASDRGDGVEKPPGPRGTAYDSMTVSRVSKEHTVGPTTTTINGPTTTTTTTATYFSPPQPPFLATNVSQATSLYDQPFYTPAEQRSFYIANSEDGQDTHDAAPPPPLPAQRQDFEFNFHPRNEGEPRPADSDTENVGFGFGPMSDIGESDSVDIVYSSGSAADRSDMPGTTARQSNTWGEEMHGAAIWQPNTGAEDGLSRNELPKDGRRYELP